MRQDVKENTQGGAGMTRTRLAVTLAVVATAVLLGGCSRGPSGLIDYKVSEERRVGHGIPEGIDGTLVEVTVVVSPAATETELRELDAYLADKYEVRPGGSGHCIFYAGGEEATAQYVAINNRNVGFTYIPPGER